MIDVFDSLGCIYYGHSTVRSRLQSHYGKFPFSLTYLKSAVTAYRGVHLLRSVHFIPKTCPKKVERKKQRKKRKTENFQEDKNCTLPLFVPFVPCCTCVVNMLFWRLQMSSQQRFLDRHLHERPRWCQTECQSTSNRQIASEQTLTDSRRLQSPSALQM